MNKEVKKIYDKLTDKIPYEIDRVLFAIIDALPDEAPPEQYHVRGANGKTCKYTPGMIIPADAIVVVGPEPVAEKASEPTSARLKRLAQIRQTLLCFSERSPREEAKLELCNDILGTDPEERLIDQQIEEVKAYEPTSPMAYAVKYSRWTEVFVSRHEAQQTADWASKAQDGPVEIIPLFGESSILGQQK